MKAFPFRRYLISYVVIFVTFNRVANGNGFVFQLYPADLKEIGSCMSSIFAFLAMFVVVKTAPFLMSHLGAALIFVVYANIIVAGVILLYFIMPETNNITLQQVEENMRN